MIHVLIDLSKASLEERENFFALPGVATAVDSLACAGRATDVSLRMLQPEQAAIASMAEASQRHGPDLRPLQTNPETA